jgi:dienelactone hydrolase
MRGLQVFFGVAAVCLAQPDPARPGPYPVGVTTAVVIDESRTDQLTGRSRTLVTEIWYPATDDARKLPKTRYSDFFPGGVTAEIEQILLRTHRRPVAELDKSFWTEAVRDAPVRAGRYPLIVFSHGNGGTRFQNTFWCDHLASHGYIVVSADHTGNARHTILDGKVIPYVRDQRLNSAADRPLDMRFLLDQMLRWNGESGHRFAGRIDPQAVAAAGMSFGAMSAVQVADRDERFRAVIPMAMVALTHTNVTVPALAMLGAKDRTIGERGNDLIRSYWGRHEGPAFLLELPHGGHFSFTDIFKVNPNFGDGAGPGFTGMEDTYRIINSYSTAFCEVYLKKDRRHFAFLGKNHWPDVLIWKAKNYGSTASGTAGAP